MEVQVNTGFLMKNEKKEKDTHADYIGTWTDENGTKFYLNAWLNTSQKIGNKYFKLKLGKSKTQMKNVPVKPVSQHSQAKSNDFVDDDIPF